MQWSHLSGKDYNPISASRPGTDNPTSAVPAGLYQFEIGTNYYGGPGNVYKTPTFPMLLRMGVFNNTELQVGYSNKYATLGLLYGGISFINGLENSIHFTTSLLMPIDGISSTDNSDSLTEFSVHLPISYSFQNGFSVWGQVAETVFNNDKLDPIRKYSMALGSRLGNKTNWFFEAYKSQIIGNEIPIENIPISIDFGITYLVENNIQFDLSMGLTFQKDDSYYIETERFIEWGLSFRLPE